MIIAMLIGVIMTSSSDAAEAHSPADVEQFLQNVRESIPLDIEQIDIVLRLIEAARGSRPRRFLDLGCGEGMLSAALLDEFPASEGWLVEATDGALRAVRQRFQKRPGVHLIAADYRVEQWVESLKGSGPFDVIISGLAIDELSNARKQALYREIFALLSPEGIFLNLEHVASATRWTESVWDDCMIQSIFGRELKEVPGRTRAEVAREYYARMAASGAGAPLEVQCDWLRETGFENVDCYLKVQELAIFGGQRAGEDAE